MVPHQNDGPARFRPPGPGGPVRPPNAGPRSIGGPGPNISRPVGPRPGGPRAPLAMSSDAPRPVGGGSYRPNDFQRRPGGPGPGPRGPPHNPPYDSHFMPSHAAPPSRHGPPMSPPGTRPPHQMW